MSKNKYFRLTHGNKRIITDEGVGDGRKFCQKNNSMPSANGVAGKHRVDDWNKTIEGLHYAVKNACIENRDQASVLGVVMLWLHKQDQSLKKLTEQCIYQIIRINHGEEGEKEDAR